MNRENSIIINDMLAPQARLGYEKGKILVQNAGLNIFAKITDIPDEFSDILEPYIKNTNFASLPVWEKEGEYKFVKPVNEQGELLEGYREQSVDVNLVTRNLEVAKQLINYVTGSMIVKQGRSWKLYANALKKEPLFVENIDGSVKPSIDGLAGFIHKMITDNGQQITKDQIIQVLSDKAMGLGIKKTLEHKVHGGIENYARELIDAEPNFGRKRKLVNLLAQVTTETELRKQGYVLTYTSNGEEKELTAEAFATLIEKNVARFKKTKDATGAIVLNNVVNVLMGTLSITDQAVLAARFLGITPAIAGGLSTGALRNTDPTAGKPYRLNDIIEIGALMPNYQHKFNSIYLAPSLRSIFQDVQTATDTEYIGC